MDDTSADVLGAVVRVAGPAVRDGLARSLFLTRNTGTTLGVRADVLRLCSAFVPNADEITICLRENNAELSDACRTAFEAGTMQPSNAGDSTQARKRTAR